ncbi:MAG: aspartate-semialdehyde dehydrogenase [Planctomycetota bacterium]
MTRVAVVGASGVVGRVMLECLGRSPLGDELPVAFGSSRSAGSRVPFRDGELAVRPLSMATLEEFDVVLFSAGGAVAREWAPQFVARGALAVDNSSAFRLEPEVPLVVPEINADDVPRGPGVVANPNCSTIILVLALHPLRALGRFRTVVSTYQAVSGAGRAGLEALRRERSGGAFEAGNPFPFPIEANLFPLIGGIEEHGNTTEERKIILESRKILGDPDLDVFATCVRVPVERCHSEAVTLLFDSPIELTAARSRLVAAPGLELVDDPMQPPTPRPLAGETQVRIGRLRQPSPTVLQFWIVGDQLLKGAALNAVQIAEVFRQRTTSSPSS